MALQLATQAVQIVFGLHEIFAGGAPEVSWFLPEDRWHLPLTAFLFIEYSLLGGGPLDRLIVCDRVKPISAAFILAVIAALLTAGPSRSAKQSTPHL
jgi:hypothetical protein